MKRFISALGVAAILPIGLSAQLDGRWEGAIQIQGIELGIIVNFETVDGAVSATIDIPQQGATGLGLDSVVHQHPSIHFQLPTPVGTAYFEGNHDGDEITGDFSQAGQAATFILNRVSGDELVDRNRRDSAAMRPERIDRT